MEAVDRVSDVVDDQFARRGLSFVKIRDASFELAGSIPRRYRGIDADILRDDNRSIRAFARVAGNISTWRLELARNAPPGANAKSIGVVVNGITLAELLGPNAKSVQGKGLGLPASAKIESRLTGDGKFVSANAVARVRNGWFQLGKTLVAFDDAALHRMVTETRARGFAFNDGHIVSAMNAVGVPVLDSEGRVVAALSLAAIRERVAPPRLYDLVALLLAEAVHLGGMIGRRRDARELIANEKD